MLIQPLRFLQQFKLRATDRWSETSLSIIWICDDFLRISHKDILNHAGSISAKLAKAKADAEYDKFKERTKNELTPVEIHYLEQFEREQKKIGDNKRERL